MLLAAFASALEPVTGTGDLYVFLEGHGRDDLDQGSEIVGWLTALYPVLLTARRGISLVSQAADFQRQLLSGPAALEYGRASYLAPESALGKVLVSLEPPQITFNYLGRRAVLPNGSVLSDSGLPTGRPIGASNKLPTPLDITVTETTESLAIQLSYDRHRFDGASMEKLLKRMSTRLEDAARLVALTERPLDDNGRPHILIHPIGGTIDWYSALGRAMDPGTVCFGLSQDDADDWNTVEDLALIYLERLQALQPAGPYTLTGWSFGAAIAYELARLLTARGESVAELALLDPPIVFGERRAAQTLAAHLVDLLPHIAPAVLRREADEMIGLPLELRLKRIAELSDGAQAGPETRFLQARLNVLIRNDAALQAWRPSATVPSLQIVLSADTAEFAADELSDWQHHSCAPLQTHVVPGNHLSMLDSPELSRLLSG
jgi:thioesterase domain-containing protein